MKIRNAPRPSPPRCSTPTGCFRPTSRPARSRGGSTPKCATCRSSRRTATPIRAGSPRTRRSPIRRALFVMPDHYVFRMLYSQGVPLEELGIPRKDGGAVETDARKIWRTFAENYHLFRGTPTRMWLDQSFADLFGIDGAALGRDRRPLFRPHHRMPRQAGVPPARAVRALQHRGDRHDRKPARSARPSTRRSRHPAGTAASSPPTGPIRSSIRSSTASARTCRQFGDITRCDTFTWHGYLAAHRLRRAYLQAARRDLDRPRPSVGADRRSRRRPTPSGCSPRSSRRDSPRATPSCSARRC